MNYLLFNHDGSIKATNLVDIITQGSNTYVLYVYVEGFDPEDYEAVAKFILPDGEPTTPLIGQSATFQPDIEELAGYKIQLTSAQTVQYGNLECSIEIKDLNDNVLFTKSLTLTINKTTYVVDEQTITAAQYGNLVDVLASKQDKVIPSISGKADKVLTVNADATALQWSDTAFYGMGEYQTSDELIDFMQDVEEEAKGRPFTVEIGGDVYIGNYLYSNGEYLLELESLMDSERYQYDGGVPEITFADLIDQNGPYYQPYIIFDNGITDQSVISELFARYGYRRPFMWKQNASLWTTHFYAIAPGYYQIYLDNGSWGYTKLMSPADSSLKLADIMVSANIDHHLAPTNIPTGTIAYNIGFDADGNLVKEPK